MQGIRDKVIAITGASSGVGEATANLLAERGAKVVLGARRQDRLEAVADRVISAGGAAVWRCTDVRRRDDLQSLVQLALDQFGALDVLVSCAGIGPIGPLDDLRVDEWDDMIDINLRGVLHGIAAALPVFRARGSGHFVNAISTAGLRIVPDPGRLRRHQERRAHGDRGPPPGSRRPSAGHRSLTRVREHRLRWLDYRPRVRAQITQMRDTMAIPPEAIARAIAFAIEQPDDVDVGDIVVRPTAQS